MIFGDKTTFAIECVPWEEYDGIYGDLRFWINNEAVGDFEAGGDIFDVVWDSPFDETRVLYKPEWNSLNASEFLEMINASYRELESFEAGTMSPEAEMAYQKWEDAYRGVAILTFPADAFADYNVYVFDTDCDQKMIWQYKYAERSGSITLAHGTYQAVCTAFIKWGLEHIRQIRSRKA